MIPIKQAKHPNVAKLFSLWIATPEAHRIIEDPKIVRGNPSLNTILGTSPLSKQLLELRDKQNIKGFVSWWQNQKSVDRLRWYMTTAEGKAYGKKLGAALTGRK